MAKVIGQMAASEGLRFPIKPGGSLGKFSTTKRKKMTLWIVESD